MPVFGVLGLKGQTSENWAHSETKEKGKSPVWDDFNYGCRKAPTSLCYGGDQTLISSVWKRVPQMFVVRWLLAAAFCEHTNQPVSVCHSLPNYPRNLHLCWAVPTVSLLCLYTMQNFWNIQLRISGEKDVLSQKQHIHRNTNSAGAKQTESLLCQEFKYLRFLL